MKRFLSAMLVLSFFLSVNAYAEKIIGRVASVSATSLSITKTDPAKMRGQQVTVAIMDNTKLKGVETVQQLQQGEKVKINAKEKNGTLEAKSIKLLKEKQKGGASKY